MVKGVVFVEFLGLVDDQFGQATTEQIIDAATLSTGGAYTNVGTYDCQELVDLVVHLSNAKGVSVDELLRLFGRHLYLRFVELFPSFFEGIDTSFEFLQNIDRYIHVEVRKLYPDAELPRFLTTFDEQGRLVMHYVSSRPFASLAEGLIKCCGEHFGETIELTRTNEGPKDGTKATFRLAVLEGAHS